MKIDVSFVLSCENKRIKKKMFDLEQELKPYWTKEQLVGDNIYQLEQDSSLYSKVVDFAKKYKKDIEFINWGLKLQITEEDRERAVAFVLRFPEYYCEEYEDVCNEYKECEKCASKQKMNDLFYVQPKGYISRHKDDCGMAGIDGTGEVLLLPKIVERLISEGVDEKYFQPVLSKSKKIVGYIFVTDNILPEGALKNDAYKRIGRCPICGNVNMNLSENGEYWFSARRMSKECIEYLKDVNYSYEFYDEYREIIVSKKIERIISKNVKGAVLEPIFLDLE